MQFTQFDTDADGTVTQEEAEDVVDLDGDGVVNETETTIDQTEFKVGRLCVCVCVCVCVCEDVLDMDGDNNTHTHPPTHRLTPSTHTLTHTLTCAPACSDPRMCTSQDHLFTTVSDKFPNDDAPSDATKPPYDEATLALITGSYVVMDVCMVIVCVCVCVCV